MAKRLLFRATGLLLLANLGACVPNRMYRAVSVEEAPGYQLAYVEFDDQGEMWAPVQLSRALDTIEEANRHPRGALVVLFVHGWMHNASPQDRNVHSFKDVLEQMVEVERRVHPQAPRPVVGAYLGWRGKSGSVKVLSLLTFYSRARAANRVAGISGTEVIFSLLSAAKQNPLSKTLVLGHSFGGRIVERAVTHALVAILLEDEEREAAFPADLVLLVNPASKSLIAKQFVDMLSRNRIQLYRTDDQGKRFRRPLVVSVTSTADVATGLAYPAGAMIGRIGKSFRKYGDNYCAPLPKQLGYDMRTAGHNRSLHNLVVTAAPLPEGHTPREGALIAQGVTREYDTVTQRYSYTWDGEQRQFTIRDLPRALNDTPYWILQVPRSLIPDHSAIFGRDTLRLFGVLLSITGATEAGTRTILVREDGVRALGMRALPDGGLLFLDRTRRLFSIEPGDTEPTFRGCLPAIAHPEDAIGFGTTSDSLEVVVSRPQGVKTVVFKTEVLQARLTEQGIQVGDLLPIAGERQFLAAAVDGTGRKLYLATGSSGEVFVADLARKKKQRVPESLATAPGSSALSMLYFSPTDRRLYAADRAQGVLYALDPSQPSPELRTAATSLGWPTSMAVDPAAGRYYLGDKRGRQIWQLECGESACSEPRVFARHPEPLSPEYLAVGPDGAVWVADLEAQRIFRLSAAGEVELTVDRVPTY